MDALEAYFEKYIVLYLALDKSDFFDKEWYFSQYPDALELTDDAVRHYLEHGYHEYCDPSPYFSTRLYLEKYYDIKENNICPLAHYELHGKAEGRKVPKIPSDYINKREKISLDYESFAFFDSLSYRKIWHKKLSSKQASILEIGPGIAPFFVGNNVFYFDVSPAEPRIEKLAKEKDLEGVKRAPKLIHYVNNKGDLLSIDRTFDYVFSCHSVEHTNDLVRHFQDVEKLLNENGEYYLIIPDKRYCVDHFKNTTSLGEILDAYYNKLTYKPLRSLIDEHITKTHNNASRHWAGDHAKPRGIQIDAIKGFIKSFEEGLRPVDGCHRWMLYPDAFKEIYKALQDLELVNLELVEVHECPRNSFEFFVRLRKSSKKGSA